MNWDQVIHGALVGSGIGTLIGLIPLGVGYLCREKKKAIGGFLGCIAGGAIGGVNAAIVVMAATTVGIVRPQREPGRPRTEWSELGTFTDKIWYVVGFFWLFLLMFGTMFVSAAFLTPLVLGVSNCAPRDTTGKVVEFVMLFGGMGLGGVAGFLGISFISRRFISSTTHNNWAKACEASTLNRSPLLQKVARYYYGLLLPRGWQWASGAEAQPCNAPDLAHKAARGR